MSFTLTLLSTPAFRTSPVGYRAGTLGEPDPLAALQDDIDLTLAAAQDVGARLQPYAARMTLDRSSAQAGMVELQGWLNDHRDVLSAPADTALPQDACAYLQDSQARALVSWLWLDASDGLALYSSGSIRRAVLAGEMSEADARSDLARRRQTLQLLTAFDEQGTVVTAFTASAAASAANGLGSPTIVAPVAAPLAAPTVALTIAPWFVAVGVLVIGIAAVGYFVYRYFSEEATRTRDYENLQKLCDKAEASGDADTVAQCRKKLLDAPIANKPPDPFETAVWVGGGVLLIYLLTTYTAPKLLGQLFRGGGSGSG